MSDDSDDDQPWRTGEGQVLPSFAQCSNLGSPPRQPSELEPQTLFLCKCKFVNRWGRIAAMCFLRTERLLRMCTASHRTDSHSAGHIHTTSIHVYAGLWCCRMIGRTRHHTQLWAPLTTSILGATMHRTGPRYIRSMLLIGWGKEVPAERTPRHARCRLCILGLPGSRRRP